MKLKFSSKLIDRPVQGRTVWDVMFKVSAFRGDGRRGWRDQIWAETAVSITRRSTGAYICFETTRNKHAGFQILTKNVMQSATVLAPMGIYCHRLGGGGGWGGLWRREVGCEHLCKAVYRSCNAPVPNLQLKRM